MGAGGKAGSGQLEGFCNFDGGTRGKAQGFADIAGWEAIDPIKLTRCRFTQRECCNRRYMGKGCISYPGSPVDHPAQVQTGLSLKKPVGLKSPQSEAQL